MRIRPTRSPIHGLAGVLTVSVCLLVLVTACSSHSYVRRTRITHNRVFNTSQLELGVENVLRNNYKLNVDSVDCPSNERILAGSNFYCTTEINGSKRQVPITVKNSSGQYDVGNPD